jgi:RNA polymerase sigma factor (sigma-70 family)
MPPDDANLLQKWKSDRDAEAFQELVQRYSRMVYSTCLRLLRNSHDAEEATQDCFLSLAQSAAQNETYLGPWLHRVALNGCLDRLKSETRRQTRDVKANVIGPSADSVAWDDLQDLVDEAIALLPRDEREAVIAHFLEGRTQSDIARAMDISQQAVSLRIKRGIEVIRSTLRGKGVTIGAGALTATLSSNAVAEASHALTAALGKLSLAGAKSIGVTQGTAAKTILGVFAVKKTVVAVCSVALVVALGWYAFRPGTPESNSTPVVSSNTVGSAKAQSTEAKLAGERNPSDRSGVKTESSEPNAAESSFQASGGARQANGVKSEKAVLQRGEIADPQKYASISGTVTDTSGKPVSGAHVSVLTPGFTPSRGDKEDSHSFDRIFGDRRHVAFGVTSSGGTYSIAGIAFEGPAIVAATAPGFLPSKGRPRELQLSPGATVGGVDFVLDTGNTFDGIVLAPDNTPAGDATIFCSDTGAVILSAPDGTFTVTLPVEYSRPSFLVYHAKHGRSMFEDIPVPEDGPIELVMAGMAGLTGTITDHDGKPAVGYTVRIAGYQKDYGRFESEGAIPPYKAITNEQGEYRIDGIESMLYVARVLTADGTTASAIEEIGLLEAGKTQTWNATLLQPMRVYGTVRGQKKQLPLAKKFVVWTIDGQIMEHVLTNERGEYEIKLIGAPGQHTVAPMGTQPPADRSLNEQWAAYAKAVQVMPGSEQQIDFTLPDSFTATAMFLDQANLPITAGIRVKGYFHDEAGSPSWSENLSPDATGHYTWDGFQPGMRCFFDAQPEVEDAFCYARTAEFSAENDQQLIQVVVHMFALAKLSGRVLGLDGEPIPNNDRIWLDLTLSNGEPYGPISTRTDSGGTFLIEHDSSTRPSGVPATSFKMTLFWSSPERKTYAWESGVLSVGAGETLEIGDVQVGEYTPAS